MVDLSSSPSRFNVLQPEQLGRMALLEPISTETNISDRMARFKALWLHYDPPNGAQYDVGNLEFDPIKIQAENAAFFEALLRHTYDGYYSHPTVVTRLGLDPSPPHPRGHRVEAVDLPDLARVRARGALYRPA